MSPPHFDIHVLSGWSRDTKLEVEREPKLAYLWESKSGIVHIRERLKSRSVCLVDEGGVMRVCVLWLNGALMARADSETGRWGGRSVTKNNHQQRAEPVVVQWR